MTPKEKAQKGEFWLEEALLDVLMQTTVKNPMRPCEIGKEVGFFRESGWVRGDFTKSSNDDITWKILNKLIKKGLVKETRPYIKRNPTYYITEKGHNSRKEELEL